MALRFRIVAWLILGAFVESSSLWDMPCNSQRAPKDRKCLSSDALWVCWHWHLQVSSDIRNASEIQEWALEKNSMQKWLTGVFDIWCSDWLNLLMWLCKVQQVNCWTLQSLLPILSQSSRFAPWIRLLGKVCKAQWLLNCTYSGPAFLHTTMMKCNGFLVYWQAKRLAYASTACSTLPKTWVQDALGGIKSCCCEWMM